MSLLNLVWTLSLSLAAVSLLGLATIFIARPFRAIRDRRIAKARAGILQVLMDPNLSAHFLRRSIRRAAGLNALSPVLLEVTGMLRGEARSAFLQKVTEAGAARSLRICLRHGKPQDRQRAAEALAAFAPSESEAALQLAWWDSHPAVRFAALRASIEIGAPPAFSAIMDITTHASPRERAQALVVIRLMSEKIPNAARKLLLVANVPTAARVAIIDGLAANLDQASLDAIVVVASDPARDIRAACVAAVVRRPGPASDAVIMHRLCDLEWTVRASAAMAAGKARLASARPLLRLLRHDEHWWVRLRASEALRILAPTERATDAA